MTATVVKPFHIDFSGCLHRCYSSHIWKWRRRRWRKSSHDGQRQIEMKSMCVCVCHKTIEEILRSLAHIIAHWWRPNKEKRYHINYIVSAGKTLFFFRYARASQIERSRHEFAFYNSRVSIVCIFFCNVELWILNACQLRATLCLARQRSRYLTVSCVRAEFDIWRFAYAFTDVWEAILGTLKRAQLLLKTMNYKTS